MVVNGVDSILYVGRWYKFYDYQIVNVASMLWGESLYDWVTAGDVNVASLFCVCNRAFAETVKEISNIDDVHQGRDLLVSNFSMNDGASENFARLFVTM